MTLLADNETTQVWTGMENITARSLDVLRRIGSKYDLCTDFTGPVTILSVREVREAYAALHEKGVKVRIITEIIPENVSQAKQLAQFSEVRHLDGVIGNFTIADETDYAGSPETENGILTKLIVSNVSSFVRLQQYFFETLWDKAVPAEQRLREIEDGIEPEKIEIIQGRKAIIDSTIKDAARTKINIDNCIDKTGPSSFFEVKEVWNLLLELRDRGVKLRFITEITSDNLKYCKEMSKILDLRHLDKVKGNFGVHDGIKYRASAAVQEGLPPDVLVISTARAIVDQQQFFFETLWNKAIPASERITELETGIFRQVTEVWRDPSTIASRSLEILAKMEKKYDFCIDWKGPSIIMTFDYIRKAYLDLVARGCKLRLITEIVPDNIGYCKEIAEFAEVRHLDNIRGNFGIVDEKIYGGIATTSERQEHATYLHSTVKEFVDQQQYFFETLWEKAELAEQRFRELEEGREPEKLELVPDTEKSIALAFDVMTRTDRELLVLFATARTFALSVAAKPPFLYQAILEKGGTVRILVPRGEGTDDAIDRVLEVAPNTQIRITDADLSTRITIMISDRKKFMSWALRDDTISDPYQAGGVATYSNTVSLAESYATIFENLWRLTEYAENLRAANLRLERNDQAMREFIDITAHELRNPIQPILGLSEILQERQNSSEQKQLLEVIVRNAHRLEQIAEDVLDVTRMESGTFRLVMEKVDLGELVSAIVSDFQRSIQTDRSGKVRISPPPEPVDISDKALQLVALADPNRIGQVLSNLLSNAIKFTSSGTIVVAMRRQDNSDGGQEAVISIADTGSGIDPNIMPRLFEKFVSRSEKGIGLGLYLSKKIVDAHGGRIWASNNANGVGATFHVALALSV